MATPFWSGAQGRGSTHTAAVRDRGKAGARAGEALFWLDSWKSRSQLAFGPAFGAFCLARHVY